MTGRCPHQGRSNTVLLRAERAKHWRPTDGSTVENHGSLTGAGGASGVVGPDVVELLAGRTRIAAMAAVPTAPAAADGHHQRGESEPIE